MSIEKLLDRYAAGPKLLRDAVAGMTDEQLKARPVPGRWSTLEVVCHLADSDGVYAERMKRVIVEDEPTLRSMDPDGWLLRLTYHQRNVEEELRLIEVSRSQMGRILRSLSPADFQRQGRHSDDGPLSLENVLERVTNHIPHHLPFIREKRAELERE